MTLHLQRPHAQGLLEEYEVEPAGPGEDQDPQRTEETKRLHRSLTEMVTKYCKAFLWLTRRRDPEAGGRGAHAPAIHRVLHQWRQTVCCSS